MPQYVFTNDIFKSGKTAISAHVFDDLVSKTLDAIPDVSMSSKHMKKNQNIRLNRPVQTRINKGIVHVKVSVDLKKGTNIQEACSLIQDEVVRTLLSSAETIPFDVQVKVESLI